MNQHPFFWSSLSGTTIVPPLHYITVFPTVTTLSYQSGQTTGITVTSDTGYTITSLDAWLGVDLASASGNTGFTIQTLTINSGVSNRTGHIELENAEFAIVTTVTVIQTFEPQPLLFIMTEGGTFSGVLT